MIMVKLPKLIDPFAMARAKTRLAGKVPISDFKRLLPFANSKSLLGVDLDFCSEGEKCKLTGNLNLVATLECQRCLHPLVMELAGNLKICFYRGTQQPEESEEFEMMAVADKEVCLYTLIEDELLLAIPMVPKHNKIDCNEYIIDKDAGQSKPFAELKNQLQRSRKR